MNVFLTRLLKIYNRWGLEIYYSQSIEKGWNGKHFSEDCPTRCIFLGR